jgi:aarF domain-containing kinase
MCSERLIVMEYVSGSKINNKEEIEKDGINPKLVADNLINIFTDMIYKYRFIHCEAHPGNILVRKKKNALGHEIILLDHGLYRTVTEKTIEHFSGLWVSLVLQDRGQAKKHATYLNINDHF